MSVVCIKKVDTYDIEKIKDCIIDALKLIRFDLAEINKVVIKPNILMPVVPDSAVITHPAIVCATINVLRESGIQDIYIVEEPAIGFDKVATFQLSGYQKLSQQMKVKLYSACELEHKEVDWKYGRLKIPKIFLESDLYINIPKIKTHGHTIVSLSLKNQKGLVSSQEKKHIHVLGLHEPLIELAKVVKPHLVIMDGICAMEGEGPTRGKMKKLNTIVVGTNMLECDIVCVKIMNIDPYNVIHLNYGLKEGLGNAQPVVVGDDIDNLKMRFKLPNQIYARKLNVYAWRNASACSMCMDSLYKAVKIAIFNPKWWLSFVLRFIWYGIFWRVNIIQGRKSTPPPLPGWTVCFGTCTYELTKEIEKVAYVPGCPPKVNDILQCFFKYHINT